MGDEALGPSLCPSPGPLGLPSLCFHPCKMECVPLLGAAENIKRAVLIREKPLYLILSLRPGAPEA